MRKGVVYLHPDLANYAGSFSDDKIQRVVHRINLENVQLYESVTFIENEIDHCAKTP